MDGVGERGRKLRSLWRDWRATARGAVAGAVAFGVVYVATFAIQYGEADDTAGFVDALAQFLGPDAGSLVRGAANWLEPDPGQVVAWFVYASHYVPLELDAAALGQSVHRSVDVQQLPVWNGVLVLVPPVVLLLVGAALAAFARTESAETPPASWLTGVRLALGYGATALLVLTTARYERSVGFASATLAPDALTVGAYCTAYALVFGTLGAAIYAAYGPWRRRSETAGLQESESVRDE